MDYLDAYIGWMEVDGDNHKDSFRNSTKRQVRDYILRSPTRSDIEIYQLEGQPDKTMKLIPKEIKTTIVSDKQTFRKRTILFLPDEDESIGTYIKHDNKFYLVKDISDVDGYPQSFVEHCNQMFKVEGEETKVLAGKDSLGRPQYKTVKAEYMIPCVATSKIYSVLDNSQMPLPEGAIMIYIPYHEKVKVPVNYEFRINSTVYQVTTVNEIEVLENESGIKAGYLEIRGQSDVKKPWQ